MPTTYHSLESKLLDFLDSPWCSLLELHAEDALVEVDRVLAGDDVLDGAAAGVLLRRGGHGDGCVMRRRRVRFGSSGRRSFLSSAKSQGM